MTNRRKIRSRSKRRNKSNFYEKIITPLVNAISPIDAFKTIVLLAMLLVAVVALLVAPDNSSIWNFLSNMLIYTALTNPHLPKLH